MIKFSELLVEKLVLQYIENIYSSILLMIFGLLKLFKIASELNFGFKLSRLIIGLTTLIYDLFAFRFCFLVMFRSMI